VGCSSDDDDDNPGTAGSAGTGGSGADAGGSGDSAGVGNTGNTGTAGDDAGGAGGTACVGDPPVTPRDVCDDIPSQQAGDEGFTVTSPDFDNCGEIPASMTCDGNDFGTGDSPEFNWEGAPEGTLSFAAVFKDISLSEDPATERFGYHWVMWDIPADTTGLPGGMAGGYESVEVPGAHQWSSLGSYGFFTPCPNPFPREAPMFTCSLTQDSYSFTLYALPTETLEEIPPPAIDATTGMPIANWVVQMGHYIESLDALAVAEYRGTSKAWAAAFVPPSAAQFPCSKEMVDDEMTDDCLH
jgi:phosphatidylethanolamine-binding protein (PEBP) family uncharacterized protein